MQVIKNIFFNKTIVLVGLLFLASCASNVALLDNEINKLKNNAPLDGNYYKQLSVDFNSKDSLLLSEEEGRIAFIKSDTKKSIESFNKALHLYQIKDEEAKINGTARVLAASTLANDNMLPYDGADFERALVNFYQGINYLELNQLSNAMVYMRSSGDAHNLAIAKRENKINKLDAKKQEYSLSPNLVAEINKAKTEASTYKNQFLNAYIYYISGNIREIYGDSNGALVDYKKALDLYPNNSFVIADAMRLSRFYDDNLYNRLKNQKPELEQDTNSYKNSKTILVVYENKFVPSKNIQEGSLFIAGGTIKVSLPVYKTPDTLEQAPIVSFRKRNIDINVSKNGEEIANIYEMAKSDLAEDYSAILARQVARLTTKVAGQVALMQVADNTDNDLFFYLSVIFGLASAATENADVRSFRTLPKNVQIAKISTTEDFDSIIIKKSGKTITIDNIVIKNGEIGIIFVIDTGDTVYQKVVYKGLKS